MQQPAECGRITSLYVDPRYNWAVTGTSEGTLTLWDLRYGIIVRKWAGPGRILLIQAHPGNISKWIIVSCASRSRDDRPPAEPLLYVYDIATAHIPQILAVTSGDEASLSSLRNAAMPSGDEDEQSPAKQILAIRKHKGGADAEQDLDPFTQENVPREEESHQDILAVHSIHGPRTSNGLADTVLGTVPETTGPHSRDDHNRSTFRQTALLVTAGEDRIVRLWNMNDVPASMVVSGSGRDAEKIYR